MPLLSIVIPTKNRYQYLKILVNTLLTFQYKNFEIIVQDNSADNNEFLSFISTINDERLKYFYDGNITFSSIENCDTAFLNARGKYICFIGDDDGVSPQLFEFVEWMDSKHIDAANFRKASFVWPDVTFKYYGKRLAGKLTLYVDNPTITKIDIDKEFKKLLSLGGQEITNIPRTYHGVVAKSCLDTLYQKTGGTYFPGPVPDMANAVGLVGEVKSMVYATLPFVISGQGANSMGGKGAQKKHHGRIEDEKSLPKNTSQNWSKSVPKFWSAPTIWAEATLKACEATKKTEQLKQFNFAYLYATCLSFEYRYLKEILVALWINFTLFQIINILIRTMYYSFQIFIFRVKTHFKNIFINKGRNNQNTIPASDILEATNMVDKKLQEIIATAEWKKQLQL